MRSLLVITTLDFEHEANQRIHHVVQFLSKRIQKVVVIHFAVGQRASLGEWFKRCFPFSVKETRQGHVRFLKVNPLGNFPENFAKGLMRFPDSNALKSSSKDGLSRALNLLGICKSLSTTCSYFLAYWLKLRKERFDMVLVEGPWEGLVGVALKRTRRVKALAYQDIDYIPGDLSSRIRKKVTEKVEHFCMKRADARISCGKLLQEYRQEKLHMDVFFVPNGVDFDHWQQAQNKIPHSPTLVYMGNIMDWTGLHWAIEALPELLEKIPKLKLTVIGRGNPAYLSKLRAQTIKAGLQHDVIFAGFVPYSRLPQCLKETDIALAIFDPGPLLRYAFPLKVVEYMSAGLPIIASEDTESARLITECGAGLTVPYGDTKALYRAICRIFEDAHVYERCAENAKQKSKAFSWNRLMARQYDYLIEAYQKASFSEAR